LALFGAMSLFAVLDIPAQTFAQNTQDQILTFDAAPNGTYPTSINARGEITGHYQDLSGASHGFLRSPTLLFETLD
jgi:hypothetical protein